MAGKFFVVVSRLNGLALDIEGKKDKPGTEVITYKRKPGSNLNQQWYVDHETGTIKSRQNNLCLDINSKDELVVNKFKASREEQKLNIDVPNGFINRRNDPSKVADIKANNEKPGANICFWDKKGSKNQLWDFDFVPPEHFFYIVSEKNGKYLQVERGGHRDSSDPRVTIGSMKGNLQQQWYYSHNGICSRLNNLPLTCGILRDKTPLITRAHGAYTNPDEHYWIMLENKLVNRGNHNYVCDIAYNSDDDGAKVIAFPYKGTVNQHWTKKDIK